MSLRKNIEQEVTKIVDFLQNWEIISKERTVNHIALLSGLPSIILLLIDCHSKYPNLISKKKIINLIIQTLEILYNEEKVVTSYCSGLSGLGVFLLKLKKQTSILDELEDEILYQIDEILYQIDEILETQIEIDILDDNYDILHGVIGIGLYFLERDKMLLVDKVVDSLQETCVKKENQIFWRKYDKYKNYSSIIDMGNAHGNSSILYFLTKCFSKKLKDERIEKLIKGVINFYLINTQEINNDIYCYFPGRIIADDFEKEIHKPENSRLAWCYGDLGVLHTLLISATQLNEIELYKEILKRFENVSKRRIKTELYKIDADFCHGTSGIAVIFNNIYQISKNIVFLKASEYWINETLKLKYVESNSIKITGYSFPIGGNNEQNLTLLEGLAGVLFGYLKFISNDMPLTEEILLLKL